MRILGVVVLSIIVLSLLVSVVPQVEATAPSLTKIKNAVKKGYNYILSLKRELGIGTVYSEYPALPIVVHDPDFKVGSSYVDVWFIPGYRYDAFWMAEARDGSISTVIGPNYKTSTYTFYIDLKYLRIDTAITVATLKVKEIRTYHEDTDTYDSEARIEIVYLDNNYDLQDAYLYVGGIYVGKLGEASEFVVNIPKTLPSMRTSIRHVDMLAPLVLYALTRDYSLIYPTASLDDSILNKVWNGNPPSTQVYLGYKYFHIYDIYMPILADQLFMTNIQEPNGDHFWDAKWFGSSTGYGIVNELFRQNGYIESNYPAYPYKSKIVGAAEAAHQDGGPLFLLTLQQVNRGSGDPLYHAWKGLYYAYKGEYYLARSCWYQIVSYWDGDGIYVSGQEGYSTVRLATAIALGSILAGRGYISWDTVDQMVDVLLQLQWKGVGHYTNDGKTIYTIVKPDHAGGFLVSYGPIGSYGYVPFRPGLIEDILRYAGSPPEYGGPIPTNAETTLLALSALIEYAYWRYDVTPPELLD